MCREICTSQKWASGQFLRNSILVKIRYEKCGESLSMLYTLYGLYLYSILAFRPLQSTFGPYIFGNSLKLQASSVKSSRPHLMKDPLIFCCCSLILRQSPCCEAACTVIWILFFIFLPSSKNRYVVLLFFQVLYWDKVSISLHNTFLL